MIKKKSLTFRPFWIPIDLIFITVNYFLLFLGIYVYLIFGYSSLSLVDNLLSFSYFVILSPIILIVNTLPIFEQYKINFLNSYIKIHFNIKNLIEKQKLNSSNILMLENKSILSACTLLNIILTSIIIPYYVIPFISFYLFPDHLAFSIIFCFFYWGFGSLIINILPDSSSRLAMVKKILALFIFNYEYVDKEINNKRILLIRAIIYTIGFVFTKHFMIYIVHSPLQISSNSIGLLTSFILFILFEHFLYKISRKEKTSNVERIDKPCTEKLWSNFFILNSTSILPLYLLIGLTYGLFNQVGFGIPFLPPPYDQLTINIPLQLSILALTITLLHVFVIKYNRLAVLENEIERIADSGKYPDNSIIAYIPIINILFGNSAFLAWKRTFAVFLSISLIGILGELRVVQTPLFFILNFISLFLIWYYYEKTENKLTKLNKIKRISGYLSIFIVTLVLLFIVHIFPIYYLFSFKYFILVAATGLLYKGVDYFFALVRSKNYI